MLKNSINAHGWKRILNYILDLTLPRRYLANRKRAAKARDALAWVIRWKSASNRCWAILTNGAPTLERFQRFERNHHRLLALLQKKNKVWEQLK